MQLIHNKIDFIDQNIISEQTVRYRSCIAEHRGAVGEVKRLLRSAFTSHCATRRGGAVGTAESCAQLPPLRPNRLTIHLTRLP